MVRLKKKEWEKKHHEYLLSPEWLALRLAARIRSGGVCEKCQKNRAVHLHHLTYERFGHEDLADLQDICPDCHQSYHPRRALSGAPQKNAVAPKPYRHRGPKRKKAKKPNGVRPLEPYWDEINGAAYAKEVLRQAALKTSRQPVRVKSKRERKAWRDSHRHP